MKEELIDFTINDENLLNKYGDLDLWIEDLLKRQYKKTLNAVCEELRLDLLNEGVIVSGYGFRNGRQCDEWIMGFNDAVEELNEKIKKAKNEIS